jgi:tetraacyldisaccharide 4'-kinase
MKFIEIIKIIFLWPFSLIYWVVTELRAYAYKIGLFRSHKASVPVISIGNIVAGGTGKTPMTIYVAQILLDKGMKVAVLSRGYKRKSKRKEQKSNTLVVSDGLSILCPLEEAGDEPFLMASRLLGTKEKPGAMVIVGKDRVAGAEKAVELGAQVIILDDGFQHLRLKRDLDIVLLDSQKPYDNGWLLPAGMLREPKVMVLTRCTEIISNFKFQISKSVIFNTQHKIGRFFGFADRQAADIEKLKSSRILLFSGIARPESFEQSVIEAGLSYISHFKFSDHYRYSPNQLKQIAKKAEDCDFLLTTEKDAVKLPPGLDLGKPLFVLPVEMDFMDEAQQQRFAQILLDKVKIENTNNEFV